MSIPTPAPLPRWHPAVRCVLFLLAFAVVNTGAAVPVALYVFATRGTVEMTGEEVLAAFALTAPLLLLVTVPFVRYLDGRDLASLGARWPRGGRAAAFRQAAVLPLAVLGLLGLWWALVQAVPAAQIHPGGLSTEMREAGGRGAAWLLLLLAGFLVQGAVEEWVVRGYVYRALKERWRWWVAALVSSLVFGGLHSINPDFSWVGLLNTTLAGMILALLVERSGSLWGASLAHGFWNFALACLFSLPVSGVRVFRLLDVRIEGPELLTGGGFGPEASLLLTVLALPLVPLLWPRGQTPSGAVSSSGTAGDALL